MCDCHCRNGCNTRRVCDFVVAGLTHIITMDLHQKEIQGFFTFPVDNLRASPFLIQYIKEEVRSKRRADDWVVSRQ